MEKFITVQIRTVYGVDKIYPLSVEAQTFARMAGTKTLSEANIKDITSLGYEVHIAPRFATAAGGVFA